jgi:chemotaxis protein methyltransferase CheR
MSLSQADFDYVRTLVKQRSALVMEDDKAYLVETRLLALARREGFDSMPELVARMRAMPSSDLHQRVVEALANNETSFFRDLHLFEMLRSEILPELLQRRAADARLHIWCAACSSGQEPYSVAMLLREHFPMLMPPHPTLSPGQGGEGRVRRQLSGWQVRIIGSDLSTEMLQRARRGRYCQLDVNRGLPTRLLANYFQKLGIEWQIKDEIRRMVEFWPINLIEAWPALPPQDIILLRNVLIYFDLATKKHILAKVRRVLRPDGYLILGGAETTLNIDEAFDRVQLDRACCYRMHPV